MAPVYREKQAIQQAIDMPVIFAAIPWFTAQKNTAIVGQRSIGPMGLYRIPLRPDWLEAMESVMQSLSLPILRKEHHHGRLIYFYKDPEKSIDHQFWISSADGTDYWCCGLSPLSKKIARQFFLAGLFINKDIFKDIF